MDSENYQPADVPDALPDFNFSQVQYPAEPEEEIPAFALEKEAVLEPLPVLTVEQHDDKVRGPIYLRTDKYRVMLSNLDTISRYVHDGPEILYMLKNHKKNADIEHRNFAKILEDIQRKLIYVDSVLFNEGVK